MSHELETAIRAARAAGKIQMKYFGKPLKKTAKKNRFYADFATRADFESEKEIIRILQKEFPNYGILSEEKGLIHGNEESRWIIDPLDGTIMHSRGIPFFGVLMALQQKKRLEVGVIHCPFQQETIFAQWNRGCFWNGKRVFVSKTKKLEEAILTYNTIRLLLSQRNTGFQELLGKAYWRTGIPSLLATQLVCRGKTDIYVGSYQQATPCFIHPWDVAAKKIAVEEAGGILSAFNGKTELEKLDSVVITNPLLHSKVIRILNQKVTR
jgi:myo-inositol-1(or 4)-monophosphatase